MSLFRSLTARQDATRGTTAEEGRKAFAGLFTNPGVLPGGSSPLVEGDSTMAYKVHSAVWVTSRGAGDGVHLWGNDGAVLVGEGGVGGTVPVAPGSGLSRIDVIYALHPSADENGDTDSVPVVAVAVGTAASSPVAPSIPAGALEIGRNTMTSAATDTAGAGNTITQTAAMARLVGSVGLVAEGRNAGQVQATTSPTVMASTTVAVRAGRSYRLTAQVEGIQVTDPATVRVWLFTNVAGYTIRHLLRGDLARDQYGSGTAVDVLTAAATGTIGVQILATATAGAFRVSTAGQATVFVEDVTR